MQAVVLLLAVAVMRGISRFVKVEEAEYAFQVSQRLPMGTAGGLTSPVRPPGRTVQLVLRAWWALPCIVLSLVALALLWPINGSGKTGTTSEAMCKGPVESSPCTGVCSPHLLVPGETIRVKVVAHCRRNETGLWLKEGTTYTGKYVSRDGWRDGEYRATPEGVQFPPWLQFAAQWVEWLRPYPEGVWFQVVGRIERGREVFPVLDTGDASKPHQFTAPRDGELVILVNDVWYPNNHGFMTVEIGRAPGS